MEVLLCVSVGQKYTTTSSICVYVFDEFVPGSAELENDPVENDFLHRSIEQYLLRLIAEDVVPQGGHLYHQRADAVFVGLEKRSLQ